mmetsp:Transcript_20676/g.48556  ORF Transcript_20676/g.48556 Transcript_20676/m.48556 type:complete len:465 (+) Transcript_20676:116-1510(+)
MASKSKKSRKSRSKQDVAEEEPPTAKTSDAKSKSKRPKMSAVKQDEEGDGGNSMKLTLEALEELSDDSDGDPDYDAEEEGADGDDGEYCEDAENLKRMIQSGQFDRLLKGTKKSGKRSGSGEEEDGDVEDIDEVEMSVDVANEGEESGSGSNEDSEDDNEVDEADGDGSQSPAAARDESNDEESNSDEDGSSKPSIQAHLSTQRFALQSALQAADRRLPWAESFAVVPPTPLPFGPDPSNAEQEASAPKINPEYDEDFVGEENEYADVHDDIRRETAFHDLALEAATLARMECEEVGIPFSRPEDFFAEMIKSDDHMAKIKDRLIFETKKMEAVERRKSNKEQTLMAKERHAHRLAEKAKQKKAHMSAVSDWRDSAARERIQGRVRDDDEDRLRNFGGPGKKRAAANKRFGYGGKRGRFKQNDAKDLNSTKGFNPKGGFKGGQKSTSGGKGKKRPGKRARDARR